MKKFFVLLTIFCFCLSLMAADGKAEPEVEKDQKPYWTALNLAWGPFWLMGGVFYLTPLSSSFRKRKSSIFEM